LAPCAVRYRKAASEIRQGRRLDHPARRDLRAKSNEDDDRAKEDRSVEAQIEEARRYARRKGWVISEDHIYRDDGISGAEFDNRPGFASLLAALPKRGDRPFDVLIMSELSRLGRDTHRTPFYVAEILDSGVAIWTYLNDSEERGDNPESRLMTSVRAYSDEAYRIRTAERVRSRLVRMAEEGKVTGGRVYGYTSVPVYGAAANGEQVRTHSEWRIEEAEAEVVRTIFRMCADGYGYASIAKALNADPREGYAELNARYFGGQRVPSPKAGRGSWATSSVREILYRDRYIGRLRYGQMRNAWKRGTKQRRKGLPSKPLERAELRIVPDTLWREVQDRLAAAKKTYTSSTGGQLWGRPGMGRESRYLLSGLGRCASCGANMAAVGGFPGKAHRKPIYYYGCSWYQNKGASVCSNSLRVRMEHLDEKVRGVMKREALVPAVVERVLDRAEQMIAEHRRVAPTSPVMVERELDRIKVKQRNLLELAEKGKAPPSLLERIAQLDAQASSLSSQLAAINKPVRTAEFDRARLRRVLRARLNEFDALMTADIPAARQALIKLLDGPISFEATPGGYVLKGRTRIGALFPAGYIAVVPRRRRPPSGVPNPVGAPGGGVTVNVCFRSNSGRSLRLPAREGGQRGEEEQGEERTLSHE
jgi:site-specific DNA recombinase